MLLTDKESLEYCRVEWLKGKPLRALAREMGVTHTLLYSRLKREYGNDVCSIQTHSLKRSLLRDYKRKPELVNAIMALPEGASTVKYYSQKADNTITRARQLDNDLVLGNLTATEYEYDEPLRMHLFRFVWMLTAYILAYLMLKGEYEEKSV